MDGLWLSHHGKRPRVFSGPQSDGVYFIIGNIPALNAGLALILTEQGAFLEKGESATGKDGQGNQGRLHSRGDT